jgi:hypothetical protein
MKVSEGEVACRRNLERAQGKAVGLVALQVAYSQQSSATFESDEGQHLGSTFVARHSSAKPTPPCPLLALRSEPARAVRSISTRLHPCRSRCPHLASFARFGPYHQPQLSMKGAIKAVKRTPHLLTSKVGMSSSELIPTKIMTPVG